MLRLERHRLGPRVYILGRRIHEWHLGVAVIAFALAAAISEVIMPGTAIVTALLGVWLVVKDWPDLTRSGRDSAGWRLGIHRRPLPLRPMRPLDDIPAVAAFATAAVGLVDLMSAVTPNVSWRGRELVHLEPVSVMRNAHALAVPASVALILTAYYLYRRRARALHLAVTLLLALSVFDVLKGLDFEEAAVTARLRGAALAEPLVVLGVSRAGDVPLRARAGAAARARRLRRIAHRRWRSRRPRASLSGRSCGRRATCSSGSRGRSASTTSWPARGSRSS